jgi:hypothetical protein
MVFWTDSWSRSAINHFKSRRQIKLSAQNQNFIVCRIWPQKIFPGDLKLGIKKPFYLSTYVSVHNKWDHLVDKGSLAQTLIFVSLRVARHKTTGRFTDITLKRRCRRHSNLSLRVGKYPFSILSTLIMNSENGHGIKSHQ